ncbi:unnamed protein product [Linum tenue]|uniref:Pentatricopeptide repeat-containing protein n=1 Tax=Linum tenue TaxID=586396 RepID=A0AAV0QT24_9ROSI|nr:unnamed protein product [Linum tenue]
MATSLARPDPPPPSFASLPSDRKSLSFELADNLLSRGLYSSAQQVIQRIISSSTTLPDAISAADFAAGRGVELSLQSYYVLIRRVMGFGEFQFARAIYFDGIIGRGLEPDSNIVNSMIICMAKLGDLEGAMSLFDRLWDKGWMPCESASDTVLRGLYERKLFLEAFVYFTRIVNLKNGKVDSAMEFLNSMVRSSLVPSVHSYTALLSALCKQNRFSGVKALFRNMLDIGVIPDHVTFLILMKNIPKGQELELAFFMLRAIARNGCRLDPCLLSVSPEIYSTMDLQHEIEILLLEIVRTNWMLANVSFGIYISALCECGKFEAAFASFETLRGLGCCPLPFTFNSLIKELCKHSLHQEMRWSSVESSLQ